MFSTFWCCHGTKKLVSIFSKIFSKFPREYFPDVVASNTGQETAVRKLRDNNDRSADFPKSILPPTDKSTRRFLCCWVFLFRFDTIDINFDWCRLVSVDIVAVLYFIKSLNTSSMCLFSCSTFSREKNKLKNRPIFLFFT